MNARDVRDSVVVALARLGISPVEIAGLTLGDALDRGEVRVCVQVDDGRRTRVVALDRLAAVVLARWIEIRGRRAGSLLRVVHVDVVGYRGLEPVEVVEVLARRSDKRRRRKSPPIGEDFKSERGDDEIDVQVLSRQHLSVVP